LDIEQRQVAVQDSDDDAEYDWQHYVLLIDLGDGQWIAADADKDVATMNLRSHTVVALKRASAFPERVTDSLYKFDALPPADLDTIMADAHQLAEVLGHGQLAQKAVAQSTGEWRVADPAVSNFGEVVSDTILSNPDRALAKGSNALVLDADPQSVGVWIHVQRVRGSDVDAWMELKRNGPGRDIRLGSNLKDKAGAPRCSLRDSIDSWRPQKFPHWPFRGPRALPELANGVDAAGEQLASYDSFWAARSGINRGGTLAHTHRNIFACLSLLQRYDQLDLSSVAGAEFLARWALVIQAGVKRSPKTPSFDGLDVYLSYSLDESGGIVTSDFQKHISEEQRASAFILKNSRIQREEAAADKRRFEGTGDRDRGRDKGGNRDKGQHRDKGGEQNRDKDKVRRNKRQAGGGGAAASGDDE